MTGSRRLPQVRRHLRIIVVGASPLLAAFAACTNSAMAAPRPERMAQYDKPDAPVETKPVVPDSNAEKSDSAEPAPAGAPAAKPDASKSNNSNRLSAGEPKASRPEPLVRFDIDEYRVEGADTLPQLDVEEAVYPFLGPGRTSQDVEKARAALENAYHSRGFQTVSVAVPQQDSSRGFIVLKVTENRVGRLRVKGSRYFDLDNIKRKADSLQEGKLPNFNDVTKNIVSLNLWPDRRVTPALRAGVTPGTVDVDLNVEDKNPLHGNVELNNRQSPNTTPKRVSASLRYDNLWQLGHSLSFTYQVAPQRHADAEAISASYLARTDVDWLNILVYGLKSKSSVATVGGANVIGPGEVLGTRGVIMLPSRGELFHTVSLGADYKHFQQTVSLGQDQFSSPVTYVPLVGSYGATWQGEGRQTQLNATITAGVRGIGSEPDQFDAKRVNAKANFFHLRADASHTQDLPGGAQFFVKAQGQVADQPLVSSEQFSLGGLETVRGYLESETLGDYGVAGTVELRSPSLSPFFEQTLSNAAGEPKKFNVFNDWRFFAFADAGRARIFEPLTEQQAQFDLASYGFGTRFKILQYLNGMILVGIPVISQQVTVANDPRLSFRLWGEF
jgi:hemolysin activation/secretion protein